MKNTIYSEHLNGTETFWGLNSKLIIILVFLVSTLGSDIALAKTIVIDDNDNSCQPVNTSYSSCAAACEADAKGCAMDIHAFINSDAFMTSRLPYPDTPLNNPNPSTPMHGLFNSMYVNDIAEKAIQTVLKAPFDPVNLPAWSIVAKYNENPSAGESKDVDVWETHMYKIPGYCPNRAVAANDGVCIGGDWFWFLYRDGFLSFDYDPQYGGEQAWGKAEAFCIDCHGAVTNTDWLWRLNYLLKPIQQSQKPLRFDNETPPEDETSINSPQAKHTFRFAELCDNVTELKSSIPYDVRFDPAKLTPENAQRMFNCYSWEAFIGLNWPALPEQRGVADTGKAITAKGNRVWETYAQVYEAFQPKNPEWTLDDKQWNNSQKLPQVCKDAIASTPNTISLDARAFQVLNESHQAYGNQFNNLVDQNGRELRYNVRFNETEWDFVKKNGYADTGNYDYHGPLGGSIVFPDNRAGNINAQGSIEIKSAWKELCTEAASCNPLDNPEEYYWRYVLIYNAAVAKSQGTQPESCRVARMGLVGLHTIFKTFWQPQWIWSTFEHVKNVPDVGQSVDPNISSNPYSLFNPQCLLEGMQPTPEQCLLGERPGIFGNSDPTLCCQNLQMIQNSRPDPNNPQAPTNLAEEAVPNHITRLNEVGTDAETLNQVFRPLLKKQGSVWQNYKLINTQWALDGRLSGDSSSPYAVVDQLCLNGTKPPCFTLIPKGERLRNTSMETYQASYCKPDDENIGNDSENCKLSTIAESPVQVSSAGCMNCHLDAGNDASFLWADGIEEQVQLGPCTESTCPVIPESPDVSIMINGLNVALNWNTVIGATGYKLHYAPYPYTGPESILFVGVGNTNNFSIKLWEGAAYYVAISAYNSTGESGYSNIEQFSLK